MVVVKGPWKRAFWTLNDHAHVEARPMLPEPGGFGLPTQNAGEPQPVIFPNDTQWGGYGVSFSGPSGTSEGSGPWEGSYYVSGRPKITGAVVHVSSDLVSAGRKRKLVHETCGLPGTDSIGVYNLNAVDHEDCRNKAAIDAWKATVVAHELGHQNSLNKCINSLNRDGRLAAIEALVETSASRAEDEANRRWDDLQKKLRAAKLSALEGAESPVIWEWRSKRRWKKHTVEFDGHSGTDGCPQT